MGTMASLRQCHAELRIVFTQDVGDFLRGLLDGSRLLETAGSKTEQEVGSRAREKAEREPTEKPLSALGFKASGFKSSFKPLAPVRTEVEDDGETMEIEMEMDEDVDGAAMEDLDGAPLADDVDGEPLEM